MNKKGAAFAIVLVVIIIVVAVFWVIDFFQRGCNQDTDCPTNYYCGSDFECHEFKIVEITEIHNNFLIPSLIIAGAIIIGAFIIKYKTFK